MKRVTLMSLLIIAVGCSEGSPVDPSFQRVVTPIANAMEVNQKDPIELFLTACNGEGVALAGTLHQKFKFTTSKSGNVSAFVTSDYNLAGVGATTGAQYHATLHLRDQEMATDNVSSFRHRTSIKLIGQGAVPNSSVDVTVHVVIVNGETKVEHTDFTTRCDP